MCSAHRLWMLGSYWVSNICLPITGKQNNSLQRRLVLDPRQVRHFWTNCFIPPLTVPWVTYQDPSFVKKKAVVQRCSELPVFTHLVNCRARIWTHAIWQQVPNNVISSHYSKKVFFSSGKPVWTSLDVSRPPSLTWLYCWSTEPLKIHRLKGELVMWLGRAQSMSEHVEPSTLKEVIEKWCIFISSTCCWILHNIDLWVKELFLNNRTEMCS